METGQPARTCVQCGAPYHDACTIEIKRCGILGCGGGFSRAETWDQADYNLSERIRRAIRKPHVTALHPGFVADEEEDGDWVRQLRRAKKGLPEPQQPSKGMFWLLFSVAVIGIAAIYQIAPGLVEGAGTLLILLAAYALVVWIGKS